MLVDPDKTEQECELAGAKRLLFRHLYNHLGKFVPRAALKNILFDYPRPPGSKKDYVDGEEKLLSVHMSKLSRSVLDTKYRIDVIYSEGYIMYIKE